MLKFFKEFITSTVKSINRAPISSDDKTRLQHFSVFLLLGIPTMVFFGLYNLLNANHLLFALILLSATGVVVGWYFLMQFRNGKIIYRINSFLFSLLILYMLFIGGEDGSKILWMFTFPLISFFLFGKNEGLFWSIAVILISILLFWNPFKLPIAYGYSNEFIIRFITTYIIVSAATYWFEYFRFRYRIDVENKHEILQQEIVERKRSEKEREKLIHDLQNALEEVKTLSGLIPICSHCKNIRDDKGYWNILEGYIQKHSDAKFSHGICPDCDKKYHPEDYEDMYPNLK